MSITLWQHYCNLAARITQDALKGVKALDEWDACRPLLRRQFMKSQSHWLVTLKRG